MTTTTTTKWEDLDVDKIVENYIWLKTLERARNKKSYDKLKENDIKYNDRLNDNLIYQEQYIENIKSDDEKLKEYKAKKKEINKRAYDKRKSLKSQSE
jgi:small-conductance mechanosensitive channel